MAPPLNFIFAPLAQLDRAFDYESKGQEFESLRACHLISYAGVAEWQTRSTQNRMGNRGGSSPLTGTSITNDGSSDIWSDGLFLFFGT